LLAMAAPAAAQVQGALYGVTFIELQAGSAAKGASLLRHYRDAMRKAPGNLEAVVGEELGRPNRFVLIEGWRGQADFDAHEQAEAAVRLREQMQEIALAPPDRRLNTGFDLAPAAAGAGTLLVVTHVDVAPPGKDATEAALRAEAAATRKDAGNMRCDVLQQLAPRLNHFNIVAIWRAGRDFDAHERQEHRAQLRRTLAPLLGALYDERLYKPI